MVPDNLIKSWNLGTFIKKTLFTFFYKVIYFIEINNGIANLWKWLFAAMQPAAEECWIVILKLNNNYEITPEDITPIKCHEEKSWEIV